MHDPRRRHHRRSSRKTLIRRLLSWIKPKPLDPYTRHQESVRLERRRDRKRQKIASVIRGAIVLFIALLVAIGLARENSPRTASGTTSSPFEEQVTVAPNENQPQQP